ncbi:F-box/kelch-repeat protein SKIP6-like [Humulus lupulus]|uniref:F-box/kelch-repeat protein SKIP6-like n=1 Tax=Humulus lupulus TaxID=3486 RepID=UPI002B409DD7|nr:F-box/kelch-repeat protein SKIP6-like [Humulus lupulus]XP_062098030.1 F-box/kelch-repeat protein SKIP6-like [Humulus lupulus]
MSGTEPSLSAAQSTVIIPSLSDDVALNCLARIPRWHHPTLSLVSKSFRYLLSSPLFFSARSLLHSTQHFLYLTLRSHNLQNPSSWVTFYKRHNSVPNDTNFQTLVVPLPPIPSPSIGSAYATLGPKIYVLGGSINDAPTSHVWVLDCRFHTWEPGPSMRVGREFAAAGVVEGKIYVMGGCLVDSWARAAHWAEVFDPVVGRWEAVQSPIEVRDKWMHASAVVGGRIYAMADRGGVVYNPMRKEWERVSGDLDMGWRGRACVVDRVLYSYDYLGKIRGFDVGNGEWNELKGVDKGLPKFLCGATMANVGGRLVVVWEEKGNTNENENVRGREMDIWCAEIEVTKNGDWDLYGKINWSKKVLSVPFGSSIVHCTGVSL